jgi:hypothetical protein
MSFRSELVKPYEAEVFCPFELIRGRLMKMKWER